MFYTCLSIFNSSVKSVCCTLFLFWTLQAIANNEVPTHDKLGGGVVKGVVTTSDGKPAPNVNVYLQPGNRAAITNAQGVFEFKNVRHGHYTLSTGYAGLVAQSKAIHVMHHHLPTVYFKLQETASELSSVIVKATRSLNEKAVAVGKVPIALKDLPQAVQMVDRALLDKQQVLTLGDALQNINGVYVMGNSGGYQEEIAGRGYAFTSNNTFKNGVRFNNATMPEISGVEKIEFLKGGSAILFGNVAAGGVLNIVTKKPRFEKGGEISVRAASFDYYKPAIDVYGAVGNSKSVAYRLNTTYAKGNSFRDEVTNSRFYINPSLLIKISPKTELLLEGDYLEDTRTADFGAGAINYAIANVPRSRFLGVAWGYVKSNQNGTNLSITHTLNHHWTAKAVVGIQNFDNEIFGAARPNSNSQFIKTDGTWIRGLQKSKTQENYQIAQVDITGKVHTGRLHHTLLFGADVDKYQTITTAFALNTYNSNLNNAAIKNLNVYDTINIFDKTTFTKRNDIPYLPASIRVTSPIQRFGVYAQDLIAINTKLKVLAGLRYSVQTNQSAQTDSLLKNKTKFAAAYTSKALSPRVGIVYQPTHAVSVFTSYTNTFQVNTGTDINNVPLKPSIIDQYEVGIKTDWLKEALSANITLYQIVNSNFAQSVIPPPASNPLARELAGQVVSKGVEVDINTKPIHGFSVIAGYSYNDTRYTQSNLYVNKNDRLRYNPAHTANASVYYVFGNKSKLSGFSIGAGAYYVGDRMAGRNTTTANPSYKLMSIPNYTTVDGHIGYQYHSVALKVKVSNVFNQLSYNVHDDNSVNPIAPRMLNATLSCKL